MLSKSLSAFVLCITVGMVGSAYAQSAQVLIAKSSSAGCVLSFNASCQSTTGCKVVGNSAGPTGGKVVFKDGRLDTLKVDSFFGVRGGAMKYRIRSISSTGGATTIKSDNCPSSLIGTTKSKGG